MNPIGFWLARPLSGYCGAVVGLDGAPFGREGFEEDREGAEQANEHHDPRGDQNASAHPATVQQRIRQDRADPGDVLLPLHAERMPST